MGPTDTMTSCIGSYVSKSVTSSPPSRIRSMALAEMVNVTRRQLSSATCHLHVACNFSVFFHFN
ncbi:hypothetical protein ISN45_At03g043200 [Arabidopsis thaliana x Arabidopsis arenosa]|uniref:Uncharacterized protein n=2 Tax=Arabidopsis TaxID=3701 RepID=A0A8T2FHF4_ARASU|nr:hypothetical protein ISN45_At03g043200 [Arabidopsis thaliana x Arabidopsis arenosa]KAG7633940.1 hypothetical protein ISN44_As03g042110 [Arabidopsis suecica]